MFGQGHHLSFRQRQVHRLRALPGFSALPDAVLAGLDMNSAELRVAAGTILVTEDQVGREAFIVLEGIAEVSIGGVAVTSVSSGAVIGEMALLDGSPRTATVMALTPMRILVLDPRQFRQLFSDPETAMWIAAGLVQRLREVTTAARLATPA
ncbi:cyclic nucleotide-binding domain-containing protein [Jatrophihabitans sp.]|uniref:cyclic nucleotide-binding domain-containing protein n=1 Tax=Jatrophihabitans sp. TaxID=1932789 RepID=UPI0030C69280|nr:cyclic nucleotide-binding protein [Jatrophihabitans sp.]